MPPFLSYNGDRNQIPGGIFMIEPKFIPCGDSFEKIDEIDADAIEQIIVEPENPEVKA